MFLFIENVEFDLPWPSKTQCHACRFVAWAGPVLDVKPCMFIGGYAKNEVWDTGCKTAARKITFFCWCVFNRGKKCKIIDFDCQLKTTFCDAKKGHFVLGSAAEATPPIVRSLCSIQ